LHDRHSSLTHSHGRVHRKSASPVHSGTAPYGPVQILRPYATFKDRGTSRTPNLLLIHLDRVTTLELELHSISTCILERRVQTD